MIYIDTSVALAAIVGEDRRPPEMFWSEAISSSRLLQYEMFNRLHARAASARNLSAAADLLVRVSLIELTPVALSRALDPFPVSVRTLDGLHLSTMDFLKSGGASVLLASYDRRMLAAAAALGIGAYPL